MTQLLRSLFLHSILLLTLTTPTRAAIPVDSLLAKAESALGQRDLPAALSLFETAALRLQQEHAWEQLANTYLRQCITYYYLGDMDTGSNFLQQAIDSNLQQALSGTEVLGRLTNYHGYFLKQTGRDIEAKALFETTLADLSQDLPHSKPVIYALKELGQVCTRTLDYTCALSYFRLAETRDTAHFYDFNILNGLLVTHRYLGDFEEARDLYEQIIDLPNLRPSDRAQADDTGAEIFLALRDYPRAERILQDLLRYHAENPGGKSLVYSYFSQLEQQRGNPIKAIAYYEQALESRLPILSDPGRNNAKFLANAGTFFLEQGKTDRALSLFQQGFHQLIPSLSPTDVYDFPPTDSLFAESWIMTLCQQKGKALYQQYRQTGSSTDLQAAARSYQLFLHTVDQLRFHYGSDQSKLLLGAYLYPAFEEAIEVFYALHLTDPSQGIDLVYRCMERSRAITLTDALFQNKAMAFGRLPAEAQERERKLRNLIFEGQKNLHTETDQWRLDSLRQQHQLLLNDLMETYPEFAYWQRQNRHFPLTDLQQQLERQGKSALQFFWGDRFLWALYLEGDQARIHQLGSPEELRPHIEDFQAFFASPDRITSDPQGYAEAAASLHQSLWAIIGPSEEIVLLPDGPLFALPFEALLPAPVYDPQQFVVHQHQIQYAYSLASLFREAPAQLPKRPQLAALAPFLSRASASLPALPESEWELDAATNFAPQATLLRDQAAGIEAFHHHAPQVDLLLLSTHAGWSPGASDPVVHFANGALSLPQIYGLQLPAPLVILSACQTGIGQYQQGEGPAVPVPSSTTYWKLRPGKRALPLPLPRPSVVICKIPIDRHSKNRPTTGLESSTSARMCR
jgi:CHAT domain-containing protein/Tfp pilus assembly protein PilF